MKASKLHARTALILGEILLPRVHGQGVGWVAEVVLDALKRNISLLVLGGEPRLFRSYPYGSLVF
jgi:hypothetical protein